MGPDKQVPNIRKPATVYGRCGGNYGRLAFANMRSAKVSESEFLRFFENAMPTLEKSRSTVADVAGQPRY